MRTSTRIIRSSILVFMCAALLNGQTLMEGRAARIDAMRTGYRGVLDEYFQGETLDRIVEERVQKREAEWAMRSASGRTLKAAASEDDSLALVALYDATDGPNWTQSDNWLAGPLDTWFGVTVVDGRVEGLSLDDNGLVGALPPELGNLTMLTDLILSDNLLEGALPVELGAIDHLQLLDLSGNDLTGPIPPEIVENAFWIIDLSGNDFEGPIPPDLSSTIVLDLSHNRLSGKIRPEFLDANAGFLGVFKLNDNLLNGHLPTEIGGMTHLEGLDIGNNRLSGQIPPGLGALEKLRWMKINGNVFNGPFPASFLAQAFLTDGDSDFRYNALYTEDDAIHDFLNAKQAGGNWADTQTLKPADVQAAALSPTKIEITWTPVAYTDDPGSYAIYIGDSIDGPFDVFGTIEGKETNAFTVDGLDPSTEYFFRVQTRTFPHAFNQNVVYSNLSDKASAVTLAEFTLTMDVGPEADWGETAPPVGDHVYAEGEVVTITATPAPLYAFVRWIGDVAEPDSAVTTVTMGEDQTVTAEFRYTVLTPFEEDSLALVALYHSTTGPRWRNKQNWLVGPLDTWYGVTMADGRVTELRLEANRLYGPIPPEIGDLDALQVLHLQLNMLKKAIPDEMGLLTSLTYLDLSDNYLTKHIPAELGDLGELLVLDLGNNRLSGEIPPALGNLARLYRIDLSSNTLNGLIPASFINLTRLNDDASDFRYNALYTPDAALAEFVNTKQTGGNWQDTQTLKVVDVQALAVSSTAVEVSWTPVTYLAEPGCYAVLVSTAFEGPFERFGTTESKEDSSLVVTDLDPETEYFFRISTRTYPHDRNKNVVYSNLSERVSAVTMVAYMLTLEVGPDAEWGDTVPAEGEHAYTVGDVVAITALPDTNYVFVGWTGDVADPDSVNTTVTMDTSKTVIAVFKAMEGAKNATSVPDPARSTLPEAFSLAQNYPNPFNAETVFAYTLPEAAEVRISVFDMQGRVIATLHSGRQEAGAYEASWHAAEAPSGTYFVRFEAGGFAQMRKCVLLK